MKKILIILLMLIFTLTWCSCGMNEKKTEVYKYSDENVSMELSVFAENDDVYKIEQVSELNIKGYSDREVKEVEYRIKEDKSISLKKFTKSLENNGWKLKK